ncbi:inner centromere protein isoform X4 [Anabrus simplex]|uniref:inner centromere protein isoform X4 n=1 Tax=Anabrus simplex TaxID=316456 RepID=UPI0035A26BCC
MLSGPPMPEALDQLFLLPERALGMDSTQLRQDLAGLDFSNVKLLHTAPQGNVWLSGAAPVDANQRQSARSAAAAKGAPGTLHWFAYVGQEAESLHNENVSSGRDAGGAVQKDREDRVRALKERQNEERQKKLEELKQQALAAQKFREQKEEERRRRMEELRQRDNDRRLQVEERKRMIWEAERDRREAILRKNQEREARIDSKRKNERSSIVFAFGSSTPRMLEPADTGGSFWGPRRATSTTNVMMFTAAPPLTRRASERELDGSKKRATSASGLDRKPGEDMRMSTSMYEIFHWDSQPVGRSKPQVPTDLALNVEGQAAPSYSSAPHTPSPRTVRYFSGSPIGGGGGEEVDSPTSGGSTAFSSSARVNRRKTDLMPTIPSPRDLTPTSVSSRPSSAHVQNRPFSRSPGRAFSMSRLDQLAQPRIRRPLQEKAPAPPPPRFSSASTKSMSRSMSHLAGSNLRRTDASRSMSQLLGTPIPPVPPPRLTRAERLRQRAREAAAARSQAAAQPVPGLRSGEATPTPPSRPLSALSQQSTTSIGSGTVNLRSRPLSAPRRPRPISIAVTGVSQDQAAEQAHAARAAHRHSIAGEVRAPKPQDREGAKPPLPKVHSTKKQPTSRPETPAKKPTDKVLKSAKASPRVTPKATPLQSPGSEAAPPLPQEEVKAPPVDTQPVPEPGPEIKPEPGPTAEELEEVAKPVEEPKMEIEPVMDEVKEAKVKEEEEPLAAPTSAAAPVPAPAPVPVTTDKKEEPQNILDQTEQEVDMTASMTAKIRITTEEEAKAALAERRRLAREQAEREAELERQRQEEERRLEEERLRQEEEEQRRFEEEQLRLVEEARRAEEERLLMAIRENERREEEERKRREEEARLKAEKEEAEKKAREEAERQRREMEIRLKKEEEERIARRKRVEAIMLRTRGKGATPTGTPTKSQGDGDGGDIDMGKDDSPSEEHKPTPGSGGEQESAVAVDSQQVQLQEQQQQQQQEETTTMATAQENGQHPGKESPPRLNNSELLLIDNSNVIKPMEISEDLTISSATNGSVQQSNGHRNGMDFVNVDNVKQLNNTSNNLLDLSEFDAFSTNNQNNQPPTTLVTETMGEFEQILDLANENVTSNGPTPQPFIAFQDNLGKKQDTSVTDLLS